MAFAQAVMGEEPFELRFVDGLDQPISGLTVTAKNYAEEPQWANFSITWRTDQNGRLTIAPRLLPGIRQGREGHPDGYRITVSHPDYGQAHISQHLSPGMGAVQRVGMIRRDAPEVERAVRGQVVDEAGQPVPGIKVSCYSAHAPGGQNIQRGSKTLRPEVETDAEGRFMIYLSPDPPEPGRRGRVVPPHTLHKVSFYPPLPGGNLRPASEPPPSREFLVADHLLSNVEPATVVLRRPTVDRAVVLRQADGSLMPAKQAYRDQLVSGIMRDPLEGVDQPSAEPTRMSELEYQLKQTGRAKFAAGRYRFSGYGTQHSVVINADSPDPIILPRRYRTACRGRIVDAVTGKPIAGALVVHTTGYSGYRRYGSVTPDQWEALEAMPKDPEPDHPALEALSFLSRPQIIRTDSDGYYRMKVPSVPDRAIYGFHAVTRNRLPQRVKNKAYAELPDQVNELPDLALMPAAVVEVRVIPSDGRGQIGLHTRLAEGEDHPDWALAEEQANHDGDLSTRAWQFMPIQISDLAEDPRSKQPLGPSRVLVPAGVAIRLSFPRNASSYFHKNKTSLFGNESRAPRKLAPGDLLRLPPVTHHDGVEIRARVIDEAGRAVEGAPVVCHWPDRELISPHNTDAEGWVSFRVNPTDGAVFEVAGRGWPKGHEFPTAPERAVTLMPFSPDEPPDPITLTLTEQQRDALIATKPRSPEQDKR